MEAFQNGLGMASALKNVVGVKKRALEHVPTLSQLMVEEAVLENWYEPKNVTPMSVQVNCLKYFTKNEVFR